MTEKTADSDVKSQSWMGRYKSFIYTKISWTSFVIRMKSLLVFSVRFIGGISLITVLLIGLLLFYINFTDYSPDTMEELPIVHRLPGSIQSDAISLISWNIGYAGLGKEMDFFYDGGRGVRADAGLSRVWMEEIVSVLKAQQADIWLLQEVDFKAGRSYKRDQSVAIAAALTGYNSVQAVNYNVPFIPFPIKQPLGSVLSGMMTLSEFSPRLARRYAYPQIAGWPHRMFLLDRCFIETRFALGNGRELVVLNTHNSAYVNKQLLMEKELEVIKGKMMREYEIGNYVIAGGDWNMNPPGFRTGISDNGHVLEAAKVTIPADFVPAGWRLAWDASVPTNRKLNEPYTKGRTPATTFDFFIVSPNVTVQKVEAIDLGFSCSDHHPVKLNAILR